MNMDLLISPALAASPSANFDKKTIVHNKIYELKKKISEGTAAPEERELVHPEVLRSWMRCQKAGLDPKAYAAPLIMNSAAFEELLQRKELLIQAASHYIRQFEKTSPPDDECYISVSDENGVIVHVIKSYPNNRLGVIPGTVWSESRVGTCAHILCLALKRPISLSGPEHFSNIFKNIATSSAPIFAEKGQLAGAVSISGPLGKHSRQTLMLAMALAWAIENHMQLLSLRRRKKQSNTGMATRFTFDTIVGDSPQARRLADKAKKYASSDANILIHGESGCGKEVYAQALHNESRPDGPFIAVNCAGLPLSLIESELFGYEAGAFTGAERQGKPGKIELASGGTLFLDEIAEMTIHMQAVLLRTLEDKTIVRIGGKKYFTVNFRLITATNKDLAKLVAEGRFREDLFYRISVLKLKIPPLRERVEDIIPLAEYFISLYAQAQCKKPPTLAPAARRLLLRYDWPGNVRQLQNYMSYAVCMTERSVILPEHLPEEFHSALPDLLSSALPDLFSSAVNEAEAHEPDVPDAPDGPSRSGSIHPTFPSTTSRR
ncbi:MAG: sigma 54-interacting transcriptional regulator [Gracilibacteraceae bacterium]|jgi:transcriptional regulator with PAS, ATPase and Fis domain|nr:sigma 54-interacting transcriptional regulator [Gracilibacteraceae bacterium]